LETSSTRMKVEKYSMIRSISGITRSVFSISNEGLLFVRQVWRSLRLRFFIGRILPPVTLSTLVPEEVNVRLCKQDNTIENITIAELLILVELLQVYRPLACFEFGTFDGRTALNMAANTPEEAIIYTLDLPPHYGMDSTALPLHPAERYLADKATSGTRYRGTPWEHKIRQLYGDSATFDYTPYQGKIDFVFIDGSHAHDYVLSDSRNAIRLLRDGRGIILWHDYGSWPTVRKAIKFLHATDERFANMRFIEGTSFACLICE
jgi:predicted O-methyltransferase YrrM